MFLDSTAGSAKDTGMDQTPGSIETAVKTRQRRECLELRLVLEAAGIASEAVHRDGWWLLIVNRNDLDHARAELEDYRRENPVRPTGQHKVVPVYGGSATAVFAYAAVIILVFVMNMRWDLMPAGQMQAGRVMAGEWWRTVTALTLHLDVEHIAANLVFGVVFGLLAGGALGGGVAWLAIVIAGALGNLVNAIVQAPTHTSIGASTAVFAALGMIVAHALRSWGSESEKPLKRWSPLIGGILLFAYTGVGGERTDVLAHVTGFLAGMSIGWFGCRLPQDWLASGNVQKWSALAALGIVTAAWIVGIAVH